MPNKNSFRERMEHYVNELVNPMSYYDWINQNTTLAGVPFTCDRYPFQKEIINDMSLELHCIKPSQIGLSLCLETPIPTPSGWKKMGEIHVGDTIYSAEGVETKVTYLSPIYTDHKCYEIEFCDGTKVVADENHRWFVNSQYTFGLDGVNAGSGSKKPEGYAKEGVIKTKTIFENYKRNGRNIFNIKNTKPLAAKAKDLLVDPYVLGLWLGNGNAYTGYITIFNTDVASVLNNINKNKYDVVLKPDGVSNTYLVLYNKNKKTLISDIGKLGIKKGTKTVPAEYLRSSFNQRLQLIQGLMDTDGTIEKNGNCLFFNTNNDILKAFCELLASMGFKYSLTKRDCAPSQLKNGKVIKPKKPLGLVRFTSYSDILVSSLERKQSRLKDVNSDKTKKAKRRKIINVVEVPPRPVRCLTVDHPSHLFLCTEAMIPTHNTEVQLRKALAFVARNPHRTLIYTMPDENMRKRVFQARVLPILTEDSIFHGLNAAGKKPIRSIETTEVNSSFMMMFPANEKAATSQPADAVFNDEVDLSDPQILALFNSRVQGSDLRMIHNYSTPTYDGLGISALYETSDQHEYLYKCPHCGHWQLPDFTTKYIRIPNLPIEASEDLTKFDPIWIDKYGINPLDAYSVCSKCDRRVTYGDSANHRWVARHPHRSNSRGYRVSPFSTRNLDAAYVFGQLLKYQLLDNMKGFHNTVLGITHESSDERLSEVLLRTLFTAMSDFYTDHNGVPHFIGIDMGKVCHITIGRAEGIGKVKTVLMEAVKVEELETRFKYYSTLFPIVGGFIDRLPLITESNKIRNISEFKVMPMQYGRGSGGMIVVPKNDEYGQLDYVEAHRTLHLDKFANAIRSGYITFAGYGTQKETIISHLRAMVRVFEEDKDGVEKLPVWKKKDKQDHYFHSLAYMYQSVVQYYDGYSYLDTDGYNSSIILGSMDNFLVPDRSISILGGR